MKRRLQAILIFTVILGVLTLLLAGCGNDNSSTQYTVTFDSMGGSAVESRTVSAGDTVGEPNAPTRSGCRFLGWYTDRENGREWSFITDTVNDNTTLYARWSETNVEISAVTGGEISEKNITIIVEDVTEVDLNDKITLTSSTASWQLLNERETDDFPGKKAYDLHNGSNKYSIIVRNSNQDLVNKYTLEIYKLFEITVKVYGPNRTYMPEYNFTTKPFEILKAPSVTEFTGYTLNGWDSDTGEVGEAIPKNASKEIALVADVTANIFTVTLDANGGKIDGYNTKDVSVSYGTEQRFGKPTKSNYIFDGWYDGDEKVADKSGICAKWEFTEGKTLTAKWTVYTLTTNTNLEGAGTFDVKDAVPTTPGARITIHASANVGYVWLGWYDGETRLSTNATYTYTMPEESKTLTAKFSKVEIEIGDGDRGYTTPSVWTINKRYVEGDKETLEAHTFNGYIFTGWYDGEGEKIGDELAIEVTMGEVNVFEPRWSKVTFEKNIEEAGSVPTLNDKYIAGDSYTAKAVTTFGYNFLGWYDGEEKVSDELVYTFDLPTEDKIFTAKWSGYSVKVTADPEDAGKASMSFTVNFDANGGNGEFESQTATPEQGWIYPELPTRDGYVFTGWYTEPECDNIFDFAKATPVHNMTLYAGWEKMTAIGKNQNYGNVAGISVYNTIDIRKYTSTGTLSGVPEKSYVQSVYNPQNVANNQIRHYFNYFTALTDGDIEFACRAAVDYLINGHSPVYIDIYNETQGKAGPEIKPIRWKSDYGTQNPVSWQYVTLSGVKAGDVIYIRTFSTSDTAPSIKMAFTRTAETVKTYPVKTDDTHIALGEETTLSAVTKEGYTFVGWFDGEEKVSDELNYTFVMTEKDREYTAKWVKSVVLAKSIEEAGTVEGDNVITKVGDEITLTAKTNAGYTFVGWYDGETLIGSGDKEITVATTDTQTVYTAKWIKVTVGKNIEIAGSVTELNGKYDYGENVTVTAATNLGYLWQGWYDGNVRVCEDLEYSFDMPNENKTFTATWALCTNHTPNSDCVCEDCGAIAHKLNSECVCEQCGKTDHSAAMEKNGYCRHTENGKDYIYMGYYPQTTKANGVTVTATPDSDGYYGGSDGERYEKLFVNSASAYYYFKVEPIKWRILSEESGTAFIMSDKIIDYRSYQNQSNCEHKLSPNQWIVKGSGVDALKYSDSVIRAWLNEDFYEKAFTEAQQAVIKTTLSVRSSDGLADADYVSQYSSTTNDKVFLPSLGDVKKYGFANNNNASETRVMAMSNYSNAKGATGQWMTRTYTGSEYPSIYTVSADGKITYNSSGIFGNRGIVPVMTITL